MYYRKLLVVLILVTFFKGLLTDSNYFLKAAKNVPRIGRSNSNKNQNLDEMGKFFMKASKSVPRIGRRNEDFEYGKPIEKKDQNSIWSELADRFEYEPELIIRPEILEQLEMGDDPLAYSWEENRTKRDYKKHQFQSYM